MSVPPEIQEHEYDLFIAYAGPDRSHAKTLWEKLKQSINVFFDKDPDPSRLGTQWNKQLVLAQRKSRASAILISKRTASAFYQSEEITHAISLYRERSHLVIPIYLDGKPTNLSDYNYGLMNFFDLDLTEQTNGIEGAAAQLLQCLEGQKAAPVPKDSDGTLPLKCLSCQALLPYAVPVFCTTCGTRYQTVDGIPELLDHDRMTNQDRSAGRFYDRIGPRLYTFTNEAFFTEQIDRQLLANRLFLRELSDDLKPSQRMPRILEIGVGTGANFPHVARNLSSPTELWGVDISRKMMRYCVKANSKFDQHPVKLLYADAHQLPFPDNYFDRVYCAGCVHAFGDPVVAMREMIRVARRNTPLLLIDITPDRPWSHMALAHYLALFPCNRPPSSLSSYLPAGVKMLGKEERVSTLVNAINFTVV